VNPCSTTQNVAKIVQGIDGLPVLNCLGGDAFLLFLFVMLSKLQSLWKRKSNEAVKFSKQLWCHCIVHLYLNFSIDPQIFP